MIYWFLEQHETPSPGHTKFRDPRVESPFEVETKIINNINHVSLKYDDYVLLSKIFKKEQIPIKLKAEIGDWDAKYWLPLQFKLKGELKSTLGFLDLLGPSGIQIKLELLTHLSSPRHHKKRDNLYTSFDSVQKGFSYVPLKKTREMTTSMLFDQLERNVNAISIKLGAPVSKKILFDPKLEKWEYAVLYEYFSRTDSAPLFYTSKPLDFVQLAKKYNFKFEINQDNKLIQLPQYVYDPYNRKVSLTKFLNIIEKKENLTKQQKNELNLLRYIFENSTKEFSYKIYISADPNDILGMSTGKPWTSCVELDRGQNELSLDGAVSTGDLVAFAVREGENKWSARLWLRHDGQGNFWPESKIYSDGSIDQNIFKQNIIDFLKKNQILGKVGQFHPKAKGWSDYIRKHIDKDIIFAIKGIKPIVLKVLAGLSARTYYENTINGFIMGYNPIVFPLNEIFQRVRHRAIKTPGAYDKLYDIIESAAYIGPRLEKDELDEILNEKFKKYEKDLLNLYKQLRRAKNSKEFAAIKDSNNKIEIDPEYRGVLNMPYYGIIFDDKYHPNPVGPNELKFAKILLKVMGPYRRIFSKFQEKYTNMYKKPFDNFEFLYDSLTSIQFIVVTINMPYNASDLEINQRCNEEAGLYWNKFTNEFAKLMDSLERKYFSLPLFNENEDKIKEDIDEHIDEFFKDI